MQLIFRYIKTLTKLYRRPRKEECQKKNTKFFRISISSNISHIIKPIIKRETSHKKRHKRNFSTNKNVNIKIIKYFAQPFLRDLKGHKTRVKKKNENIFSVVFLFYGSLANIIFRWDHHGFRQFG